MHNLHIATTVLYYEVYLVFNMVVVIQVSRISGLLLVANPIFIQQLGELGCVEPLCTYHQLQWRWDHFDGVSKESPISAEAYASSIAMLDSFTGLEPSADADKRHIDMAKIHCSDCLSVVTISARLPALLHKSTKTVPCSFKN